jgi:hypothetical protein
MEVTGQIFTFFVFVVIAVVLYYLYNWLRGSDDLQNVIIFNPKRQGMPGNGTNPVVFNDINLPPLYPGGEFSVSTWIYINNWGGIRANANKIFFQLSGSRSKQTMVMYLGQNVNKLSVRVSSAAPVSGGSASSMSQVSSFDDASLTTDEINKIINANSGYSDASDGFKKCDIEEIDLQRWVCITVCLSGKTVDVYMDGKLSRSCVLRSMYEVDGDLTTVQLGGPNGFGGYIGQTQIANYAYSPDQVYKMYQNGPMDQSLWAILSGIFSVSSSYSIPDSVKANVTIAPVGGY